ncbi:multicopper oxidase [Melanomma pulvis-pyrius CBS 109.77]|uniref:Multicopper oxidase n=1 Tax=Melanomma pulvis-pyrius CBS 109.77 TaxID=1314802 RepID=A0A6A6WTG2_9PLEO|nr:multicopper oxidase [Melanomma pulvis-pyrius CBS 109.77]
MFRLLLLGACASLSLAKTVVYHFDIDWVSAAPDGFVRPVIGINGEWPIPTIEVDLGDTVVVHAKNSLCNQTTSLHFHGMAQKGANAYDGAVGVAQCPISPGESFTYNFTASPAGTHWYHSHDKGQYPDGLRGKMIVHDWEWEDSLEIDEQIYLSVSDWYHSEQPVLIEQYLSPENREGRIPPPDSILFNDARDGPTLYFEPRKRYLIRLVSTSALVCTHFHIDGHNFTVVAVDGVQTHPELAHTILICSGQSYDMIVTGKEDATTSFQWIAKMSTDMMTHSGPSEDLLSVIGRAGYDLDDVDDTSDSSSPNVSPQWSPTAFLNDMTLKPLDDTPLLTPVDQEIRLSTNQTYYEGIGTRIGLGYSPWTEPKVPSFYTALSTGDAASDAATYGPGVDPWVLRSNNIVQIYMENPQQWPHPMHLHGHYFQVVARGIGVWDRNEDSLPEIPMMRDTVVIPPWGFFVLRFRADNPGVWFFHCHMDLHLMGGMASTFIEAPQTLQEQQTIPPGGADLCARNGRCSFGNCACQSGNISAKAAEDECNTIFNSPVPNGAMISWDGSL